MSEQELMQRMKDMARRAGAIALDYFGRSTPTLKADNSVVTQADAAIARLIHEALDDLLRTGEHILIEEEDTARHSRYFDQKQLEAAPYLWTVDPIDGTRPYANRLPTFGIAIGVLKHLRPWLGIIYLPVLQQLFYADGQKAYFVQNPFSAGEAQQPIEPLEQTITAGSVFFGNENFLKRYAWQSTSCHVMVNACAAVDMCWPSIGRGCGCFMDGYLWDFAGAWPIARAAGLELREVTEGTVLERIHTDIFQGQGAKTWRLRQDHVLSSARNFPLLREKVFGMTSAS